MFLFSERNRNERGSFSEEEGKKQAARRFRLIFFLRSAVLAFLSINLYLYLDELVSPIFLGFSFVAAIAGGWWAARSRLRVLPALGIAAGAAWLVREIFFFLVRAGIHPAVPASSDFLLFGFDRSFLFLFAPLLLLFLLTLCTLRFRRFLRVEVLIHAGLMAALFWSQGHYQLTLYPHPLIPAIAVIVVVLGELFLLILSQERHQVDGGGKRRAGFLLFLLPMAVLLLFVMLDHYNRRAVSQGGGLIEPTLFRFDFSEYVQLESEISMSDDLVLLYRTEGPANRMLLRRYVLSGYKKRSGFFHDAERTGTLNRVPDYPVDLDDPGYRARRSVRQEYFMVNFDPSSLIAVNHPVRVVPLRNWDSSSFLRVYRVFSMFSEAGPFELMDAGKPEMEDPDYKYYTEYGGDERIAELAEEVTDGVEGYLDKVLSVNEYLQSNYYYSLKPGVSTDGNQLHHFLFESKKGYCSYYAFSMALMLRSLGIPARVAVGFFVDPDLAVLNFYPVRANMAHAWVEVYFGEYGWIDFDPTSRNLAPGENFEFNFGMDMETLSPLIEEILENQSRLEAEEGTPQEEGEGEDFSSRVVEFARRLMNYWYLVAALLYVAMIAAFRFVPLLPGLLSRRPRKQAVASFRAVTMRLAAQGISRLSGESREEFVQRLESRYGIDISSLFGIYQRARFAPRFERKDKSKLKRSRKEALRSYREAVPRYKRIFNLISPRGMVHGVPRGKKGGA